MTAPYTSSQLSFAALGEVPTIYELDGDRCTPPAGPIVTWKIIPTHRFSDLADASVTSFELRAPANGKMHRHAHVSYRSHLHYLVQRGEGSDRPLVIYDRTPLPSMLKQVYSIK